MEFKENCQKGIAGVAACKVDLTEEQFDLFSNYKPSTDIDDAWQALNPGEADIHPAIAHVAGRKTRANTGQSIVTTR